MNLAFSSNLIFVKDVKAAVHSGGVSHKLRIDVVGAYVEVEYTTVGQE